MQWSRWLGAASWLALTAPLGACVTVGPDYTAPRLEAPEAFAGAPAQGAESLHSAWWQTFGSETLNALVSEAFDASPTVGEANAVLDRARAARDVVFGGAFPRMNLSARAEDARINATAFGFDAFPTREISRYSTSLGISYDLDLFGGQRRAREAAFAQLDAEEHRRSAAYLTLAADITTAAVELAIVNEEIAALEQIVADDEELVRLAQRAVAVGAVGEIDRIQAETQLHQDAAGLPRLRGRRAGVETHLAVLAGRMPGQVVAPHFALSDFAAPDAPASIPSELLRSRPDILAAEAAFHAATAQIGVRVADQFPQLRMSGNLTQTALDPSNLFSTASAGWSFGPEVSLPIFRGGALRARVREAEAEARAAESRYRATVLRAFGQVTSAYADVEAAQGEYEAHLQALVLAEQSARLARRSYEVGAGTLPEALDAQRRAGLSRRAVARAAGGRLLALARLHSATAGL
jgi:NodT family efflux transporter outer membrane factor (OMF) lipoprotein